MKTLLSIAKQWKFVFDTAHTINKQTKAQTKKCIKKQKYRQQDKNITQKAKNTNPEELLISIGQDVEYPAFLYFDWTGATGSLVSQ